MKAVVRVNGEVEKKFDTASAAALFAKMLIHQGIKKEDITCRWENFYPPKQATKCPLEIVFDINEQDVYRTLIPGNFKYYAQIELGELNNTNPKQKNKKDFYIWLKLYSLSSNQRIDCIPLRTQTHLDLIHKTLALGQKEMEEYELVGKVLANI